jgi:hypothetical protein
MLLILILVICIAIYIYYSGNVFFKGKHGGSVSGGKSNDLAVVIILKTPLGVQEMRKNYIKTDSQKPHITLGYLNKDFDEDVVLKHLRSLNPAPIVFNKWKHTKSFIALLPENISEINKIIGPMDKYIETGPRGGFHMSLAYRAKSAPLDDYTHTKAHKLIEIPITCKVAEVRISKRKHGEWTKYKSVEY